MLQNNTLQFLRELKENNNKPWFEANKTRYQQAQADILHMVERWIQDMSRYDEDLSLLDPKKCVFRIYRDARFSADKSPYKSNLGAYLNKGGKATNTAGYYMHIEPGNCFFGAGNYMPMPDELAKIRQEIDYNFEDFRKMVSAKKFHDTFGALSTENKLKRPPKGYEEDNPAIEYLKLKGFTVFKKMDDSELLQKDFPKKLTQLSLQAKPFVDFLNNSLA